jgi:hypothetical protein
MKQRLKGHIADNLWLWACIMAAVAAIAAYARTRIGLGYHLGDLAAIALMVGATLLILISQRRATRDMEDESER